MSKIFRHIIQLNVYLPELCVSNFSRYQALQFMEIIINSNLYIDLNMGGGQSTPIPGKRYTRVPTACSRYRRFLHSCFVSTRAYFDFQCDDEQGINELDSDCRVTTLTRDFDTVSTMD